MFDDMGDSLKGTFLFSLVLLVLGLLYLSAALYAIKMVVGYLAIAPDANWMIASASLLTVVVILLAGKKEY